MLQRHLSVKIQKFFNDSPALPLVINGTRQTGKTLLIREFGKTVPQYTELGMRFIRDRIFFEENYSLPDFWKNLTTYKDLSPQLTTLLVIDDLSESMNAFQWIKTVKLPEGWRVVALTANKQQELPALRLFPLSFHEFLLAMDEKEMADSYLEIPYPPHDFRKLKNLFHLYTLIGGMPEVVSTYAKTRELADLAPVYEKIQDIFEDEIDNNTYSSKVRERSKLTLQNAFPFATERISFSHFASSGEGSREISKILRLLHNLLLVSLVYPVTETEKTQIKKDNFQRKKYSPRLHLPDTGLINYFTAVQKQVFETNDLMSLFNGQIIRHITGQEIAASGQELSFWIRSKPQSEAEVDYILMYKGMTLPVVIKKGEPGRLRSLFQFMDHCSHPYAVRIWDEPVGVRQVNTLKGKKFYLLSLPYFLAGKLPDYLDGFVKLAAI